MSTLFTLSKFRELINNAIKRYRTTSSDQNIEICTEFSCIVLATDFSFPLQHMIYNKNRYNKKKFSSLSFLF